MKSWNELSLLEKVLLGAFLITILALVPEMGFLIDIGGIELITGIIFIYASSVKMYFQNLLALLAYPQIKKKIFLGSALLSSATLLTTGAMLFSGGLFLILMYMGIR